ncbi:VanR-ABDEGLN family response regulator transcription factor [Bacilliculturomica massiliensis]|uniref:VanR-ABDEGLN family response regulator transcription factor n=1 Tax=Bacilliculturomica massiliensis TaxID=1917867 RepID=UPI0010318A57|nr:VanR-ABDEGLN family response regulator transcription factor [Bacilliculturomica massiliensis]
MSAEILIVDDEQEIADLIELYLKNENYNVHKFYTSAEALACVETTKLDMAILDVMLPGVDGFGICQKIREKHNYPIIMLTAKDDELDKITGLTLGADDYITKPFRPLELIARVKAQLRRFTKYNTSPETPSGEKEDDIIAFSGLVLNPATHECTLNEKPLSLTPLEFSILWVLCKNRGKVVSSEDLFYEVWGEKYYSNNSNTVMVHIRHLREKMNDSAEKPKYIKTVWGVGYKIEK